jgi:hypothetical protein
MRNHFIPILMLMNGDVKVKNKVDSFVCTCSVKGALAAVQQEN